MRFLTLLLLTLALAAGIESLLAQKPPEKVVFQSKMGNVTFDHAAHAKRANNDCKRCHDKLFKQSSTEPINFKANMHKTAEAAKTSCGACHTPGGASFETKGNCAKCHVK
ncbi:MAG TPA: c(7)-type cytochrome triheme domain-containing protein [Bryobacteraceae bacterium]|nr:c(7)-type cytochrome triheme domain-containing protein [Bryobacteraceae bacterium]